MKIWVKWLATALVVGMFSGCATDGIYNVGKTVYIGGKAVVIQNADLLDEDTLATLKKADEYASRYDEARDTVKKSLETSADTNSSAKEN